MGDKGFIAGNFDRVVLNANNIITKKNFAVFDVLSGTIKVDSIVTDGHPSFLEPVNGELVVSGKFKTINGVSRLNFAILDTGTYDVKPLQLSPTDPLTTLTFSGGSMFASGEFNGLNAVTRKGFAAIDSATGNILPWSPENPVITERKRMEIHGDSLFVLGITSRPSSCMTNDYNTIFRVISISTGLDYSLANMTAVQGSYGRMNDFAYDGNYLYVSQNFALRRYSLPSLTYDASWGINFSSGANITITHLICRADSIYALGDNRFDQPCTTIPVRRAWFLKFVKSNCNLSNFYSYEEVNNIYQQPVFENGFLSGNKLYVQGIFRSLNGNSRTDYACINTDNGILTSWAPSFGNAAGNVRYNGHPSPFQLFRDKFFFGAEHAYQLNTGSYFSGFAGLDTLSGNLSEENTVTLRSRGSVFTSATYFTPRYLAVTAFLLNTNDLVLAGNFDSVNNKPACGLVRFRLNGGGYTQTYTFLGNGNWNVSNNWYNRVMPPAVLPAGAQIIINPTAGGQCILNITQNINAGARIALIPGKTFSIAGRLNVL